MNLDVLTPDPRRTARVREQCKLALSKQAAPARRGLRVEGHIETLVVASFCVFYALAVAFDAFRMRLS